MTIAESAEDSGVRQNGTEPWRENILTCRGRGHSLAHPCGQPLHVAVLESHGCMCSLLGRFANGRARPSRLSGRPLAREAGSRMNDANREICVEEGSLDPSAHGILCLLSWDPLASRWAL